MSCYFDVELKRAKDKRRLETEIEIMKKLPKHPNIVTLLDVYEEPSRHILVLEHIHGGDLFDRIVSK